ncbi:LacI family DNA-binding transcriptional regulator [Pseudotabrizicola sp.]|uniref:LacI family DNA-binding transcriptional regulator n=1 Tax=Pseudotabrizicola sp. TaxID=2939647 RepID=UPI0027182369|nr:LacI family DNA-binding transcriptional regulator [Pseudotabrizicola sp.]MDO8881573.1 LacI family DNA-binding transcriptional regulator [Pseudotabrizicola sp.]
MTTIKDIAQQLGLSAATVSRALAGNARIPETTRDRVQALADQLGYAPNRAAQSLVGGRTSGFAGLVLTDPGYGREDSYLGEYISGLGHGLAETGIDLFLAAIPQGQSELSVIRNIVTSRRADGLILGRTSEVDPRVDYLIAAGFPFVTHGRVLSDALPYSWVDTDGTAAFAEAFDLLYALGHRRFALLTIEEAMTFRHHRTEGVMQAMERCGDPSVTLTIATSPRYDPARRVQVVRDLLTADPRPTAILAMFDSLALNVLHVAESLSLSVPRDLSVIGYDNITSAAMARPGLTTFDTDTFSSARDTGRMLVERIKSPDADQQSLLIRPKLVLRASHGPAPA